MITPQPQSNDLAPSIYIYIYSSVFYRFPFRVAISSGGPSGLGFESWPFLCRATGCNSFAWSLANDLHLLPHGHPLKAPGRPKLQELPKSHKVVRNMDRCCLVCKENKRKPTILGEHYFEKNKNGGRVSHVTPQGVAFKSCHLAQPNPPAEGS